MLQSLPTGIDKAYFCAHAELLLTAEKLIFGFENLIWFAS